MFAPTTPIEGVPDAGDRRRAALGRVLLTLAFAALFSSIVFHSSGGLQLATLTDVEVALDAIAGLLVMAAVLAASPQSKPWGVVSVACFGLLAFVTGCSILWAINPSTAWIETNRTIALFSAFMIGVAAVRLAPNRWRSLLGGLLLSAVVISGYSLLTKVYPDSFAASETYGRLRDPFGYWNAVGLTAALGLPAAVWLGARREGHGALAILAFPASGLLVVTLLMSYSRGALLAAIIGLAFWLIAVPLRLRSATLLISGGGLGLLLGLWAFGQSGLSNDRVELLLRSDAGRELGVGLLALIILLLIIGLISTWLRERTTWSQSSQRGAGTALIVCLALIPIGVAAVLATSEKGFGTSVSDGWTQLTDPNTKQPRNDPSRLTAVGNVRSRYWRDAITIFKARPIIGVGAGGYANARLVIRKDDLDVLHAHGFFVQTAADLGLIGLAVTLALLAAWLAGAWRATGPWRGSQRRDWSHERVGLCAMAASVVVFGVHSLVDWTWLIPGTTVPVLVLAGWLVARGRPLEDLPELEDLRLRIGIGLRTPLRAVLAVLVLIAAATSIWAAILPQRAVDQNNDAIEALSKSDTQAAQNFAREASASNPLSVTPLFTLAAAQSAAGQSAQARATFESAVHQQPSVVASWLALARFELLVAKDPEAAMAALKPALYLDPRSDVARALYLQAYRAAQDSGGKKR